MTSTDRRLKLSARLHEMFPSINIYYDPLESVRMEYPAIVYKREKIDTMEANNKHYIVYDRYTITDIRKNADDEVLDALDGMPNTYHERPFIKDDLHHDTFTTYI